MTYPCIHGVTRYCGICVFTLEPQIWTVDDPKMWKEQCRVGDIAFQHLFATTHGLPVPDWVTEGLPNVYNLLSVIKQLKQRLEDLENRK